VSKLIIALQNQTLASVYVIVLFGTFQTRAHGADKTTD